MQKKRSIKSKVSDFFVVFFCLAGTALSLWLFYEDFYAIIERQNEKPIATVAWKKNTSQRKFSDRLVWDRLQQNSSIYNGDTIRTANNGATTIALEDNTIELGNNTIIQLIVDRQGETQLDFSGGDISAKVGENAKKGLTLKSGNVTVSLEKGSSLSAITRKSDSQQDLPLQLQLTEGSAFITDESGSQKIDTGDIFSITESGKIQKKLIRVLEPEHQTRVLSFDSTYMDVKFSWTYDVLPEGASIVFETATDKNFSNLVEQIGLSGLKSMTIRFEEGENYWRFYLMKNGEIVENSITEGKIGVLYSPAPNAIVPEENDQFYYRTKEPSLRFVWTGNEQSSRYLFEIADNPEMKNPVISQSTTFTSSILSSLGFGTWYWRVTPYYSINNIGYASPSKVYSFSINKLSKLSKPKTLAPANGGFVSIASGKDISTPPIFSWKKENDAAFYTFKIAKDSSMKNVVATEIVDNNYIEYVPPAIGRWYWTVSQTDSEGNESETSTVSSFMAMDKEIDFNLLFPPDEYQIAEARLYDTRFTWKNNLPDNVILQIATDKNFVNLVFQEIIKPETLSFRPKKLNIGDYYWRLVWGQGENQIETQTRKFSIVPSLEKPLINVPRRYENVIVRPDEKVLFQWLPVDDAQYYHIQFYFDKENDTEPILTELYVEDTQVEIDFNNLPMGNYRWTIQAFADETLLSTRRVGILAESFFQLTKIYPLSMVSPKDGSVFSGMEGFFNPAKVEYLSRSFVSEAELVISREKNALPMSYGEKLSKSYNDKIVYREKVSSTDFTLPPLNAGTYWYTINAKTSGNYDISSEQFFSFEIEAIPPFEKVKVLSPKNYEIFDEKYLTNSVCGDLIFESIDGADAYNIVIKDRKSDKIILDNWIFQNPNEKNIKQILDFSEIGLGDFSCTIRGVSFVSTKNTNSSELPVILKDGIPTTVYFSVSLPPEEIYSYDLGDLYGN